MTADVGDEPEPVEAERDEFEPGAAHQQMQEILAVAGEGDRAGSGGGTGSGGTGCDGGGTIGGQLNWFTRQLQAAWLVDQTTDLSPEV